MSGELSVLNCTAGDIRIKFDKENPVDTERAKRMIQDMLRRGYILVVEAKGKTVIAKEFDAKHGEYIVAEGALYSGGEQAESEDVAAPEPALPKRGKGKRGVPMKSVKTTAFAPMAGG
jgi:hypothetical protein